MTSINNKTMLEMQLVLVIFQVSRNERLHEINFNTLTPSRHFLNLTSHLQ